MAEHPGVHLTINLTPALLWQIEDYTEHGATDQALELTLKPAEALTDQEREQVLCAFFDAHWHNQIFPHPRYENASAPGVDLGTWIGEEEENRGWELLGQARDFLSEAGATPETAPAAFEALYMAEGSDWFWWFGEDQNSGNDDEFDDLFRTHLKLALSSSK